jgi:hypothetical protein
MSPRVSIVMPTYNRADSILRAVDSIRAQWFEDWELVVVDDGSTDGTADVLGGLSEPRIRVVRQANGGTYVARNTGLGAVRGDFVAFLDSDDEWCEWHLALAMAFFTAHPAEHIYTDEFWQISGKLVFRDFHKTLTDWYPQAARRVGSTAYSGEPPLGDPYLRAYATRSDPGPWAGPLLERVPHPRPFLYSGRIYPHWKWGYLGVLQSTVLSRAAVEAVGPFDTRFRGGSDYRFLARAAQLFASNMLSIPGATKHETGPGGRPLAHDHIATGRNPVGYYQGLTTHLEELFLRESPDDWEVRGVIAQQRAEMAESALENGRRDLALASAEQALRDLPHARLRALVAVLKLVPGVRAPRAVWRRVRWACDQPARAARLVHRVSGRAEARP